MDILTMIVAAALLLFGRELYWLFVGAVGFLVGVSYAPLWLDGQPEFLILIAALGLGLVGIVLAIVLQRVALGLAGFLGGGYFAMQLVQALGADLDRYGILAFVAGGLLMALLVLVFLDPALIAISALVGAAVIAQELPLDAGWRAVVFAVLVVLGISVQAGLLYRRRSIARATS